jgi:hypothetical protein
LIKLPERDLAMTISTLRRGFSIMIAVAALCAAAAGCANDIGATAAQKTGDKGQLRYYGGPKSPMWQGQ